MTQHVILTLLSDGVADRLQDKVLGGQAVVTLAHIHCVFHPSSLVVLLLAGQGSNGGEVDDDNASCALALPTVPTHAWSS
jgi:hypothetical protein